MTFDQRGWLFTILTALIVSPAIYNEFAPKGDERATPAMRVVTPKGQTKANLMPHNMAEGVLNLSNTPASFNSFASLEAEETSTHESNISKRRHDKPIYVPRAEGRATSPLRSDQGEGSGTRSVHRGEHPVVKRAIPSGHKPGANGVLGQCGHRSQLRHELGHAVVASRQLAQPRKLASPSGAGHPGDSLESGQ